MDTKPANDEIIVEATGSNDNTPFRPLTTETMPAAATPAKSETAAPSSNGNGKAKAKPAADKAAADKAAAEAAAKKAAADKGVPNVAELIAGNSTSVTLADLLLDAGGETHKKYITSMMAFFDKEAAYNQVLLYTLLLSARARISTKEQPDDALTAAFKSADISLSATLKEFVSKAGRKFLLDTEELFNTRRTDFNSSKEGMRPYGELQAGGMNAIGVGVANVKNNNGDSTTNRTGIGIYIRNSGSYTNVTGVTKGL